MKCPTCHHEFALTWSRYLQLVRRKFPCPRCATRLGFATDIALFIVSLTIITVLLHICMHFARQWIPWPWFGVVGLLFGVSLILPVGKLLYSRRGRLDALGEPVPAAIAFCAECKSEFPIGEMIMHNGAYCCGSCKSAFLQKLVEGAVAAPRRRQRHPLLSWWFWLWFVLACLITVKIALSWR